MIDPKLDALFFGLPAADRDALAALEKLDVEGDGKLWLSLHWNWPGTDDSQSACEIKTPRIGIERSPYAWKVVGQRAVNLMAISFEVLDRCTIAAVGYGTSPRGDGKLLGCVEPTGYEMPIKIQGAQTITFAPGSLAF